MLNHLFSKNLLIVHPGQSDLNDGAPSRFLSVAQKTAWAVFCVNPIVKSFMQHPLGRMLAGACGGSSGRSRKKLVFDNHLITVDMQHSDVFACQIPVNSMMAVAVGFVPFYRT